MKTRNGFVSNSSSSSFIILIEAEAYNNWIPTLDQYQKQILDHLQSMPVKIFNIDAFEISGSCGNYSSLEDFSLKITEEDHSLLDNGEHQKILEKYGYELEDGKYECWDSIKFPNGSFRTTIDM